MDHGEKAMAEQTMRGPLASGSAVRARFEALAATRGYDVVIRVLFICWILFLAVPSANGVVTRVRVHPGSWDPELLAELLARGATLLFFVLAAWLVLIRIRPVSKASGLQPRLSALAGSFLLLSVVLFPRQDLSIGLNLLSAGLLLLGHLLAVCGLVRLGRSFSIMAEARRLVTDGPYALVRHPLYVAEEISAIGLFLQHASLGTALLLIAHLAFQLQRMRNEEQVLRATFPEYETYAVRTRRLIPGVY
jgi:protein-S-isoprenylcysteine O-methyltransferase Ste14